MEKAFVWGLNYTGKSKLNGCINDANNWARFLMKRGTQCKVFTDKDNYHDCTRTGMMTRLREMNEESYNCKVIWWIYSGHGSSRPDKNKDEKDGKDELLVPVDYQTAGSIADDELQKLFEEANPACEFRIIFDCCHSATLMDLLFRWNNRKKPTVENIHCSLPSRILTLSGCTDSQTSADADIKGQSAGALSALLLEILEEDKTNNAFDIVDKLRSKLKDGGFTQIPKLCSTYNLAKEPNFFPVIKRTKRKRALS